jgi:gas vesicle protein
MDPEESPERVEPERPSRSGPFALGLFVGALVGAAVALLFAPAAGRQTRRHLQRRLHAARERLGDRLEELDDVVRSRIRRR